MQQTAENLHETLESFREEGAHLLLPSTYISELPPYHKIVVDRVLLSPKTDDGDVYMQDRGGGSQGKAKYAPTHRGLMKLGNAAGIMWDPNRCLRLDDRRDRNYVVYQAVGGIKKMDGSPAFLKAEYDLDFEVVEEEIREGYENKRRAYDKDRNKFGWWHKMDGNAQDDYIEKCIRRDVLQKRKHKLKLAESGALDRVIRPLLGLKSTYTTKELEKPFIAVRTIFQPDYSDPEIKKQLAAASIQAVAGVFGSTRQTVPLRLVEPPVDVTPEPETEFPEDIPEAPSEEKEPQDGPPDGAEGEVGDLPDPATADFMALDTDGKLATIGQAAKQRGIGDQKALWTFYREQTGKQPPKKVKGMPEEDMVKLFKALLTLPVVGDSEIPDDDIPF